MIQPEQRLNQAIAQGDYHLALQAYLSLLTANTSFKLSHMEIARQKSPGKAEPRNINHGKIRALHPCLCSAIVPMERATQQIMGYFKDLSKMQYTSLPKLSQLTVNLPKINPQEHQVGFEQMVQEELVFLKPPFRISTVAQLIRSIEVHYSTWHQVSQSPMR